ncbi:unnamed protein product [Bemisia tabaci]|uniref:ubiquitinyl hydrolase 1 n=1 Tax=Bemisia tabaci TaxID=7038 RepID=A0A9P0G2A1_BEMTA|nr:unnamed protein product [Bemisia tabaci]
MDQLSEELEFLDLSDLGDKERHHVQSVLYSRNPNAAYPQLPWQVSLPVNIDPYQESVDEVQWNHKQQYEPDNSGEMINYEAESCDMGIEEGCESVEQPVDYQSASNMIPAASVIMVQNYSPGIINHVYSSVTQTPMYSTPSNEINGSSQKPRRTLNNKMGIKGMPKMGIRHRQPNVDAVDVMPHQPPPQNPPYFYPYQYPYFPGPPNQLPGAPMSTAQHATGSPLYLPTVVNSYPPMYYQPAYCSPPLPINQHTHEPLEMSPADNILVKSDYLEEVPVVSVGNAVPYNNNDNNNHIEDNTNISCNVNSSLNSSSNLNNNNNYSFTSIKDDVVKSSEISDDPSEIALSEAVNDEKSNSVSSCKSIVQRSETTFQPDSSRVNVSVSTNSTEPILKVSDSRVSVSQTITSVKNSVSNIADIGVKSSHSLPAHTAQPAVTNKTDSGSAVGKPSSSHSPISSSCSTSKSSITMSSDTNDSNVKSISKAKEAAPASVTTNSSKSEKSDILTPIMNGPPAEAAAPARRSWAALVAGGTKKPISSPTVFSVNVENPTQVDTSHVASHPKLGSSDTTASMKSKLTQPSPRPQPPRSAAKHRPGAPTKSQKSESASSSDVYLQKIAELLSTYKLDHKVVNLLPRGLNNRSSYCYINATLQALLACPPLYNLLKAISSVLGDSKQNPTESSIPFISSLVSFVDEFSPLPNSVTPRKQKPSPPSAQKHNKNHPVESDPKTDPAFEPSFIYKMLASLNSDSGGSFNVEGRQEDAEEFLSCLLNGLNDEMVELQKYCEDSIKSTLSNGDILVNGDASQQNDHGAEWQRVKAKNKSAIVRDANVERTPLSDIFRGKLKSQVSRLGGVTSCNIQPFFTLQLDIEKAKSVSEALGMLVDRDQLEGVTCSKTNQEVEAWQKMTLEELPCVLLLHLKCFDFKQQAQSCAKIIKNIDCPIDLELNSKWMSYRKTHNRKYKLFAVVYHEGKEASKGHYIADVYHHGYESWIRYDDSNVKFIDESEFLKPKPPRVPYLLYYKRIDTLLTPVISTKSQPVNSTLKNR